MPNVKGYQEEIALLQKLRQGNERAIEQWYKEYAPKLKRYLSQRVSNQKDAEELNQDVFVSCLESLPLFQQQSSLWTWMCSIARHEVADYFRKKYAKRVIQAMPFLEALIPAQISNMHGVSEQVNAVLNSLSHKDRELLLLKYVDRISVEHIARRFGVSAKSAESSLFRARNAFRVAYSEIEGA